MTAETTVRRMPARLVELTLPAPYDVFHVTANMAFSGERLAALGDGSTATDLAAALGPVLVGHDICDEEGADLPAASDPAFWAKCPPDLIAVVMAEIKANLGRLSKASAAPR